MRLICLAAVLVVGFCFAYARFLEAGQHLQVDYSGPATFVNLTQDPDDAARWMLVCSVNGTRVIFPASEPRLRRAAADLHPGDSISLHYCLPTLTTARGPEYGPPVVYDIRPLRDGAPARNTTLALHAPLSLDPP